ncbi:MAG: DUF2147 domain-containing protein [Gammaproteobacteria bacterium]|nr:DUF2147 domain-containing protein [Gammaproteobacteria bacterium]
MRLGRSICILFFLSVPVVFAASPEGLWQTLDEYTHTKQALVRVDVESGRLSATIVQIYSAKDGAKVCSECPGKWHDEPILGMKFAWGFKPLEKDVWGKGRILDPKTGKIYHANITVDGDHLLVRGYIGMPMFGRTHTWERALPAKT